MRQLQMMRMEILRPQLGLVATVAFLAMACATSSFAQSTVQRMRESHAAQVAKAQTNWPQDAFDNARSGFNPFESVLSRSTVRHLKQEWTFNVGGYVSSPAIVDGVAYTGSGDGYVYAVNATTGALIWKIFLDGFGVSWATVVNGRVYIGTGVDHGFFYALNAKTGTIIWKFRPGGGVFNSPAVLDGRVYFGANDSNVYAIDAATGAVVWTFSAGNLTVFSNLAVADKHVYVTGGTSNGATLFALNVGDGTLAWSFGSINAFTPPIYAQGKVYLGEADFPFGGFIYAFDAVTGADVWTLNLGTGSPGFLTVAKGVIYTDSSDGTDSFLALDAATGKKLWGSNNSPGPLVVANGVIYGFPKSGRLIAMDTRNGKLLKTVSTIGGTTGLAVVDGKVYVSGWIDTKLLIRYGLGK